jgi:diaminopropionate ammonia-lyase
MAGLNAGDVDGHAWPLLKEGVDAAITVTDDETHEAMRALAEVDIVAGECGAASLAAARAYFAADNPLEVPGDATVILISTEGVH